MPLLEAPASRTFGPCSSRAAPEEVSLSPAARDHPLVAGTWAPNSQGSPIIPGAPTGGQGPTRVCRAQSLTQG